MEELQIRSEIRVDDTKAKADIDNFRKTAEGKAVNLRILTNQVDFKTLHSQADKLRGIFNDAFKLDDRSLGNLKAIESTLKQINKLTKDQEEAMRKLSRIDLSNVYNSKPSGNIQGVFDIDRLVGNEKESLKHINELEAIGKELSSTFKKYSEDKEKALRAFEDSNKKANDIADYMANDFGGSNVFKNAIRKTKEAIDIQKTINDLNVELVEKTRTTGENYDGTPHIEKYKEWVSTIERSAREEDAALNQARDLSSRLSELRSQLKDDLVRLNQEETEMFSVISKMYSDERKTLSSFDKDSFDSLNKLSEMLQENLNSLDKSGLNFNAADDILEGFRRYNESLEQIKKEYNTKFGGSDNFKPLQIEGIANSEGDVKKKVKEVEDNTSMLEKAIRDRLETLEKYTSTSSNQLGSIFGNAFDLDTKSLGNLEKVESVLKEITKLSKNVQTTLFGGDITNGIDVAIKEYLAVNKQINDAVAKLHKAESEGKSNVSNTLRDEISLLEKKESQLKGVVNANDQLTLKQKEYIQLEKELNAVNALKNMAEVDDKAIVEAQRKLNAEKEKTVQINKNIEASAQAIAKIEKEIGNDSLKSSVKYLDSNDLDGIKAIITQAKNSFKDLTTTIYADGRTVRKEIENIDKAVGQMASQFRQAETAIKSLSIADLNAQSKGDFDTSKELQRQIASWKEYQDTIKKTASDLGVLERVEEKVASAMKKTQDAISRKENEIKFKIDVDQENATQKIEQFKEKTISNLKEIERKFDGTLVGSKMESDIKEIIDDLDRLDSISLDKLSGEFKRITQDVTNMRRDLNYVQKEIGNGFFNDLYDSMRTYTLGDMLGDSIVDGARSAITAITDLDAAFTNMMKVAPESFKGTASELEEVRRAAIDTAKDVGQSSAEVIEGISSALQAGANSMKEAQEIARQSAILANVGDIDQGQASEYINSILSAYGGIDKALQPVQNRVKGMNEDYNNLVHVMDLLNYAG